jgi:hypothetical protein
VIDAKIVGPTPGVVTSRMGDRAFKGLQRVVRGVTNSVKATAKAQVATKLTARAGNLVTAKLYDEDAVGYIHSRWFRGPRGGKVQKSGGPGANDILALHEQGGTIRPVRRKYLLIPFGAGRSLGSSWRVARELNRDAIRRSYGSGATRIEYIKLSGDRVLLVERAGRQKGRPVAILVRQVKIPKRLDFGEVKRRALQDLKLGARAALVET